MTTQSSKKTSIGAFCWADLASTDTEKTLAFYSQVLGWTSKAINMGDGPAYHMLSAGENEVGGLYQMDKERMDMGLPSHWTSYVLVDDIDAAAKKAEGLGANVVMQPFDVGEKGMMSILQDPTGATFALWKDKSGEATEPSGPGTLCWNELMTDDVDKAGEFYTSLFGWKQEAMSFGDMEYAVFKQGDESVAGMMTLPAEAKANGAPPYWLVYVSVDDCDASIAKAQEHGGGILTPATDFEGVGRGAMISDPTGGVFGIIKLGG
jgi:predicted enzyme related to lactoylglutathione lyase